MRENLHVRKMPSHFAAYRRLLYMQKKIAGHELINVHENVAI